MNRIELHIGQLWDNASHKVKRLAELGIRMPAVEAAVKARDYTALVVALAGIPTSEHDVGGKQLYIQTEALADVPRYLTGLHVIQNALLNDNNALARGEG